MMNLKSLPDTNVWLYLASARFPQHQAAKTWFASVSETAPAFFCRATQMSLLRLLTQPEAMLDEVCTQLQAWNRYEQIVSRPGVSWLSEPDGVDEHLRKLSMREESSPKRWADDYLIAFSTTAGLKLITFDRRLAARAPHGILLTR